MVAKTTSAWIAWIARVASIAAALQGCSIRKADRQHHQDNGLFAALCVGNDHFSIIENKKQTFLKESIRHEISII